MRSWLSMFYKLVPSFCYHDDHLKASGLSLFLAFAVIWQFKCIAVLNFKAILLGLNTSPAYANQQKNV